MEYLYFNETGHWVIREIEHELHSGDPVRLMLDGHMIPARIELDSQTGKYVVIIDAGEKVIQVTPYLDIRAVLEGIL